jgi:hypothetical protein
MEDWCWKRSGSSILPQLAGYSWWYTGGCSRFTFGHGFNSRWPQALEKSVVGSIPSDFQFYQVGRYNKTVWFSIRAITNIITLWKFIDQYCVTYDSDDLMFAVHRESESKPNMEFKMHKSGLHYYDPRKEHHLTFANTVSENKTGFTKRQIKCAEIARNLYKTLSYPPKINHP